MLEFLLNELTKLKEEKQNVEWKLVEAELEGHIANKRYFALRDYKGSCSEHERETKICIASNIVTLGCLIYLLVTLNFVPVTVMGTIVALLVDGVCLHDFYVTLKRKVECKDELKKENIAIDTYVSNLFDTRSKSYDKVQKLRENLGNLEDKIKELEEIIVEPKIEDELKKHPELMKSYLEKMYQEYLEEVSNEPVSRIHLEQPVMEQEHIKKYQRTSQN